MVNFVSVLTVCNSCLIFHNFSDISRVFWADWYLHGMQKAPSWLVASCYILKIVTPNAIKMHSLAPPDLTFLCKTFSKLFKFTLQNTLSC